MKFLVKLLFKIFKAKKKSKASMYIIFFVGLILGIASGVLLYMAGQKLSPIVKEYWGKLKVKINEMREKRKKEV